MTMAQDLSLNGGFRYSSYSTVGAVTSYKMAAEWQPIDDFRFRASYNRAARAPNVLESVLAVQRRAVRRAGPLRRTVDVRPVRGRARMPAAARLCMPGGPV